MNFENKYLKYKKKYLLLKNSLKLMKGGATAETPPTPEIQDEILIGDQDYVLSVAFSSDSKYLVTGSVQLRVKIWLIETGECMHILTGHTDVVTCVAFSSDNRYVVSGSDDNNVIVWSTATGNIVHILMGHTRELTSVAFSNNGMYIVSGSRDNSIKIWLTETGNCVQTLIGHSSHVLCVAFSNNGMYVVSGSRDNTAKIWSTETWGVVHTLTLSEFGSGVSSVAFSSDSKYIATGTNMVDVWLTETGQFLGGLTGHYYVGDVEITSLAFSSDNKYIMSGTANKILIHAIINNREVVTIEEYTTIGKNSNLVCSAFSPDNKYIALALFNYDSHSSDITIKRITGITQLENEQFDNFYKTIMATLLGNSISIPSIQEVPIHIIMKNFEAYQNERNKWG